MQSLLTLSRANCPTKLNTMKIWYRGFILTNFCGVIMSTLSENKCVPCKGDSPHITQKEIDQLHPRISDWDILSTDKVNYLYRSFEFKNFSAAVKFVNRVSSTAEKEGHHPKLILEWGKVQVMWWTHKIKGLHKNDFIMAAKTDSIWSST